MAFAATTIWEGRTNGATDQGGGFDPGNANFATDLTTDTNTGNTASPVVSSASYNFAAGDVGAYLFVKSGTNWIPGWYQIASVASNKATLTAGVGTSLLMGTNTLGPNYQRPNGLNTAAGVATTGTPTGGTWGIDYSQQAGAGITYTDMVIDGATNTIYTSAGNPVGVNVVGNVISVNSGTGFTVQRVQVSSVSGTQATVDKSLGTLGSTGGNGKLGGAIGSTSAVTALTQSLVAGNKVYLKATGTTTLTSTTTVTASAKGDVTSGKISVEGYTTNRGQRDGRPIFTSATNSVALFTLNDNDFMEFVHLKMTHTAATRGGAFTSVTSTSSPVWVKDCVVDGCLNLFASAGSLSALYVEGTEIMNTTSSTAAVVAPSTLVLSGCDVHDNTGDGVRFTSGTTTIATFIGCIFDTNVNGVNNNNTSQNVTLIVRDCLFVDNTADGLKLASSTGTCTLELANDVFYNNTTYGIENLDAQAEIDANARIYRNCAFGANGTAAYAALSAGYGEITLTADPFVSRSGRNFALNSTPGGGALLRAAGFPNAWPAGTTVGYRDVGPVQVPAGPVGQQCT